MRRSVVLRQRLDETIKSEIAERTRVHQLKVAAVKAARARPLAAGAPPVNNPLIMLAHGDSWFDYPLTGNGLPFDDTDIIAQLEGMGTVNPIIQNVSHYGDATTVEMSWSKQQRLIDSLRDADNWGETGKPDAILFSGGGDDIAGDQFCIFLDYANSGRDGLSAERFQDALDMVRASYQDLFLFRDRNASDVVIFGHCYDFPIPDGRHPLCAGPWLQPSLRFAGWNAAQGKDILHQALVAFKAMLCDLASNPANKFILVDTQNTLDSGDWANELHPYPAGFKKIAQKFVDALRAHFGPNRI